MALTITEALAEIKTIGKRITSKRKFIGEHLARQNNMKDPLEKDGGSTKQINSELQAVGDLEERIVTLRRAILVANMATKLKLGGTARSVQDWLTWRREVSKPHAKFLAELNSNIQRFRAQAAKNLLQVADEDSAGENDVVIHLDEKKLFEKTEELQVILGTLDGKLSLLNARTEVTLD